MKNLIIKFISFLLLTTATAQAYDVDTHFYGTYSMARFAGIRHEVALKIATGAQWMDESYLSDPLSMIILPDVGIKKRRLLHFPGTRIANKLTVSTLPTIIDPSSKVKLKTFTETEADHDFASELFTEGLMQGNLIVASVGLHTLEDSYAHAGTISELGHAHFWHHPDRPYIDQASIDKYFEMCKAVFKALAAMRELLPINAIDMNLQIGGASPNYQMNARELGDAYAQLPDVRRAVSRQILNEKEFVDFVLKDVFGRANRGGYVNNGYQGYLGNYNQGQDSYEAAGRVALSMPREMVNISKILADSGRPNLTADYVLSVGGLGKILTDVVNGLMEGIVPRPLNSYHKFEKEEDGPIWKEEIDIRVANMRALIKRMYNKDIFFQENKTKDEAGFLKEMSKNASAQQGQARYQANGVEVVTFNLDEKYKFNHAIFKFLFPKLVNHLGTRVSEIDEMAKLVVKANADDATLLSRATAGLGAAATVAGQLLNPFSDMRTRFSLVRQDITQSRIVPNEINKFYRVPRLLQEQTRKGTFAPLISHDQVELWINRR